MNFTAYIMDEILDPTGLIEGKRYEFIIDVDVDEDDELYHEGGIAIRAIVAQKEDDISVASYFINEKASNTFLEFALEEDEEAELLAFCKEHILAGE